MANVITLIATKGGTGKTTMTAALAGLLETFGYRCLIIDTDPQASCSTIFDVVEPAMNGMTELLANGGKNIDASYISKTHQNIDIILADFSNKEGGAALSQFNQRGDHAIVMNRAVKSPVLAAYDFILIDTQGAAGPVQRSAALAANVLLSPFTPSVMDVTEFLNGTRPMIEDLNAMADYGLSAPPILAFANNMQAQTSSSKTILAGVREAFAIDPSVRVLNTAIRTSTHFQRALTLNVAPHTLDKGVSTMLHSLLWEIFPNLTGKYCDDWIRETSGGVGRFDALEGGAL